MKKNLLNNSKNLLTLIAGLALTVGLPIGAKAGGGGDYYHQPTVKQMKVKDHKVKVKVAGGKAKIKVKRNGKEKVKIKGPNGEFAARMASNANAPHPDPAPYYGK